MMVTPPRTVAILVIYLALQDPVWGQRKNLTVMGFLPMSGGWSGGATCLVANNMAIRRIREEPGLLDDYDIQMVWRDTECNGGVAVVKMFEMLYEDPVKVMIMGGGCSVESEATAQVCHLWNLTQISYGSSSSVLSDRVRFPTFFRLASPDTTHNPARVALMKHFNWKRVATINQARDFFSMIIDDFVRSVQGTDVTIISQEIFQNDPSTRVENLKKQDARIIFTACYTDSARKLLCSAYKNGLYGPRIVWVFVGWYGVDWWKVRDVPCTLAEMEAAAEGAVITGSFYRNPIPGRGYANLTVEEFDALLTSDPTYKPEYDKFIAVAGVCYDVFWAIALALNCTVNVLRETGHPKTLDQFTYKDRNINNIITSCQSKVRFKGVSGNVQFGKGADPIKNVRLARIQNGVLERVGTYRVDVDPPSIEWIDGGIKWKDGIPPRDATLVTNEEDVVPASLYFTMAGLAAAGIALAIGLFVFNITNMENKIVKMSSPNINNVLLFGCVLTYCSIFMERPPSSGSIIAFCKAKNYCFIIGFTISFGALFSKTWRVYRIFTNKKLLKMSIKDYQLLVIVAAILGVIVCVIIVREIVDPQTLLKEELTKEVYASGNDAEVHPYIWICYSDYSTYFAWTVYIIEGTLIAFGAFLAWETRHVKIEALNDSHQIGMCLYNVVVLSAVGLTLSLVLEKQPSLMYGINSGCIILGTTVTQVVVFVPKVVAVRQQRTNVVPLGTEAATASGSNPNASRSVTLSHVSAMTVKH